jgi:excisionase family DNA binding protein
MTARLLTARDLAERLGVSTETILRWTRRGELPAVRLPGGAIRYREEELEAWLDERAAPAVAGAYRPSGRKAPPGSARTPTEGLTTGGTSSHG